MFTQICLAMLVGILFGIISGITPGVHINLVSVLLVSLSPILLLHVVPVSLAVFIMSMSVTHTFLDAIPSIFLGAPESEQVLGVLPGHRFVLRGKGMLALKLTVMGSLGAIVLSIVLFPIFVLIVKYGYPLIESSIKYLVIAVVAFMIIRDRKKIWALFVFLISGLLGIIVFNIPLIDDPLFPLLSGLFGLATLIYSLKENSSVPTQKRECKDKIPAGLYFKALFSGCFSGFLTAVLPGLGAGMASVISSQITRRLGDTGFMMLVGSISTFNFVLSLVAYYTIDRARNGSIIAVQQFLESLGLKELILMLCVVLAAGSVSAILSMWLGSFVTELFNRINYQKLILVIIAFISCMCMVLTGWKGMIILMASTSVGLIPAVVKTTRTMAMGSLIMPVLAFLFSM